jgi:hypothetical protein
MRFMLITKSVSAVQGLGNYHNITLQYYDGRKVRKAWDIEHVIWKSFGFKQSTFIHQSPKILR